MTSLAVHAGPIARQRLLNEGLRPESVRVMLGASGGPKWFVLYGLDRYLFGQFFAGRREPLFTLGSSAGAWRMCCLATADPIGAIDRLARLYSQERYSAKPKAKEVSEQAVAMLSEVLGSTGAAEIADNDVFHTHIVADRCKGLGSSAHRFLQSATLMLSASANALSRRTLSWFFQRTLFTNMGDLSPWSSLKDIDTTVVTLTENNVFDAMIASGSIPFVLEGVRDIEGARPGLYWDGGITDYHFDFPFWQGEGLVLYPHFTGGAIPGWFDKHLGWRRAHAEHFNNVVMLAPTEEFVRSLPGGKLSDRADFRYHDYEERVRIFRKVLDRSQKLAEELDILVHQGISAEQIRPIGNLR